MHDDFLRLRGSQQPHADINQEASDADLATDQGPDRK